MEKVIENGTIFHFDIEQGTDEWLQVRAGKATASKATTLLVSGKQDYGFGVGAITEMYKCVEETMTGVPRKNFSIKATEWGKAYEPEAIEWYSMVNFVKVHKVGFVEKNKNIGASPDALIPSIRKGLEIKCFPVGFIKILDTNIHGKEEYEQCQFNMWCSGYKSWDLVYYHPYMPDKYKMIVFTFTPDTQLFLRFEERTTKFMQMVADKVAEMPNKKLGNGRG